MNMKRNPKQGRKQRGFTLVEMSVSMAAAGLLFAAVTGGQELVDQAKATKLLNDVKAVEAQIQQYAQLKGRMPGDCDGDGLIDFKVDSESTRADTDNNVRALKYNYTADVPTTPADGGDSALQSDGCTLQGTAGTSAVTTTSGAENANTWLNDLKLAGVVSDSAPNRKLTKMVNEDFLFVGNVIDNGASGADGAAYNAIVLHNVPQWMARRLSTAINGQDSRADRSRVRILKRETSTDGTYQTTWQTLQAAAAAASGDTAASRDGMVSVAYFYDRIPESQQGKYTAGAN